MTTTELQQLVSAIRQGINPSVLPYQLGQQLDCKETAVATSLTNIVTLCLANPLRVAVGFSSGFSGGYFVSTNNAVVSPNGFVVGLNVAPIWLTINENGTLPQLAWYTPKGQSLTITVWEVIWRQPH